MNTRGNLNVNDTLKYWTDCKIVIREWADKRYLSTLVSVDTEYYRTSHDTCIDIFLAVRQKRNQWVIFLAGFPGLARVSSRHFRVYRLGIVNDRINQKPMLHIVMRNDNNRLLLLIPTRSTSIASIDQRDAGRQTLWIIINHISRHNRYQQCWDQMVFSHNIPSSDLSQERIQMGEEACGPLPLSKNKLKI